MSKNSIQEFGVSLVIWLRPKEAGGNQGTERHTQSCFWSPCWCGINDIKVFITQHYLVWNGSSISKLPLNVKKVERKEFTVFLSAKIDFFFLTERTFTSADAEGCLCRTVLSFGIFGTRILINLTDGVFNVRVGLHRWYFQLEELLLPLKLGFMWTSKAHCSSKDSSAKISPGSSHQVQILHLLEILNPTAPWLSGEQELKLIEKPRTNNCVSLCLLMTHRHEGEIVCSELALNPSRHQSPGLILH